MGHWIQSHRDLTCVLLGTFFGLAARLLMLRSDYRQYPAHPHGLIVNLALGMIAGALGSVAVPALYHNNYTAITFLSLAAQQFREVRNMERNTLTAIDKQELVPRGAAYIEGMAVVFEGRNYLAIFTALVTSLAAMAAVWWIGVIVGAFALGCALFFMRGKNIGRVAEVEQAPIRLDGPNVYVGGIYMMNVGLAPDRETIAERGVGLLITPKNGNSRVTLANLGQRQAILYDLSTRFGVYRDDGEPTLIPLAKLSLETGQLAVLALPREREPELAVEAVRNVPLLESAVRLPVPANRKQLNGGSHGENRSRRNAEQG
ncbi:YIEGIA family protein [Cohnella caldifontis]|uniref:YIEGIA family protein n=1 Tax=Cohnella caldifontis TaxID=3027471 RepID=UPI0023EAF1C0|nr:YIEGIA family protein [Cohnella sp. YIM B05605]